MYFNYISTMGECSITFPGPVTKKTMAHLIIDYLKYILYYRGQFPLPLDQLKLQMKDNEYSSTFSKINNHIIFCDESDRNTHISSTSVTNSRSKQKFFETISKFDEFFNELSRILETKKVMEIVLNLGPNLMQPKELYHIAMPIICQDEECTSDYASVQNCKVQFFRNIITSDIWADLKTDSILPISVLLLLEKGVPLEEHMELKRFYALPKNCKQRTLRFVDKCIHTDNSSIELESISIKNNPTSSDMRTSGLWVKLKPDLKGFKSYKESSN